MELSLGLILTVVGLGIIQLTAGFILGRCFPRPQPPEVLSAHDLAQLAQEIFGQVDSVAEDVSEHRRRMQSVQEELAASVPHHDPKTVGEFLVTTVKRVMEVNERLQSRLLEAESSLESQGEQLRSHITAALTDVLTGLHNRRAFEDDLARRLAQAHRKGHEFCLMMIDADHFKALNDRYGHQTGDDVLKWLAGVLRCTLGETEMIARIGGEEFVAVIPRLALPEAARIAQRTLLAVHSTPLPDGPANLQPTISLGLAAVRPSDTGATLLRRADEALYYAKHHGRKCGYYYHAGDYRRIEAQPPEPTEPASTSDELDLLAACSDLRQRIQELTHSPSVPAQNPAPPAQRV